MIKSSLFITMLVAFSLLSEQRLFSQQNVSVDDVVDPYLKEVGGLERLQEVKSLKVQESIKADDAIAVTPIGTRFFQGTKNLLTYSDGTQFGFDGKTRWMHVQLPNGTPIKTAKLPQSLHFMVPDPVGLPLWLHRNRNRKLLRVEVRDDPMKLSYVLSVQPPEGLPDDEATGWPREFVFDRETSLLKQVRFDSGEYTFDSHRTIEGIQVPFKRSFKSLNAKNPMVQVASVELIEFNIELDDLTFGVPK